MMMRLVVQHLTNDTPGELSRVADGSAYTLIRGSPDAAELRNGYRPPMGVWRRTTRMRQRRARTEERNEHDVSDFVPPIPKREVGMKLSACAVRHGASRRLGCRPLGDRYPRTELQRGPRRVLLDWLGMNVRTHTSPDRTCFLAS